MFGFVGKLVKGLLGKGGPLAVGVVDQIGKTGEVGLLLMGASLLTLAGGAVYFIVKMANYFFGG